MQGQFRTLGSGIHRTLRAGPGSTPLRVAIEDLFLEIPLFCSPVGCERLQVDSERIAARTARWLAGLARARVAYQPSSNNSPRNSLPYTGTTPRGPSSLSSEKDQGTSVVPQGLVGIMRRVRRTSSSPARSRTRRHRVTFDSKTENVPERASRRVSASGCRPLEGLNPSEESKAKCDVRNQNVAVLFSSGRRRPAVDFTRRQSTDLSGSIHGSARGRKSLRIADRQKSSFMAVGLNPAKDSEQLKQQLLEQWSHKGYPFSVWLLSSRAKKNRRNTEETLSPSLGSSSV